MQLLIGFSVSIQAAAVRVRHIPAASGILRHGKRFIAGMRVPRCHCLFVPGRHRKNHVSPIHQILRKVPGVVAEIDSIFFQHFVCMNRSVFPSGAKRPADSTSMPGSCFAFKMASAIGLLHVLPVQTKRIFKGCPPHPERFKSTIIIVKKALITRLIC